MSRKESALHLHHESLRKAQLSRDRMDLQVFRLLHTYLSLDENVLSLLLLHLQVLRRCVVEREVPEQLDTFASFDSLYNVDIIVQPTFHTTF